MYNRKDLPIRPSEMAVLNIMIQALRSELHYPPVDIEAEVQKVLDKKEMMKELKVRKKK